MGIRLVVVTLACALAGVAGAQEALAASASCHDGSGDRCGWLVVPLDPTAAAPGTLTLRYRVQPASGTGRGVVLALAGGPGQAANRLSDWRRTLARSMPGFDVVTLDVRGTGQSGALDCFATHATPTVLWREARQRAALIRQCADELGPSRVFYGSRSVAADIEALRLELGVAKLVVAGVSYGTLQAQAYAQLYPSSVQALVLDSVVDPAANDGLDQPRAAATERILRELCAKRRCAQTPRRLVRDVALLQRRIERHALAGSVIMAGGRRERHTFGGPSNPGALLDLLTAGDFSMSVRTLFPGAVHAAVEGDPAPLLRLDAYSVTDEDSRAEVFSSALFLATSCRDVATPWSPGSTPAERQVSLAVSLARIQPAAPWTAAVMSGAGTQALCASWPDDPDPVGAGTLPDVPALLVVGRQDTRTPVSEAQAVAARLPQSSLISVPDAGHSVLGNVTCADHALRSFVRRFGRVTGSCPARRSWVISPAAPTRDLVGPSVPRRLLTARVLDGVWQTLEFARSTADGISEWHDNYWELGGLRSGQARVDYGTGRMLLVRYSDIPGIVVSGSETEDGVTDIRVSGRLDGHVQWDHEHGLRGEIGGRRLGS